LRPIIHSVKHYVQKTLTTVTTGVTNSELIVSGVESTTANLVNEVPEGSIVKSVFIEMWAIGSVSNQFFTAILEKTPAGSAPATSAQMAALGTYANKKNILYTTQGLASNDGIAAPIPIVRQWFKIPKGKQRFGLGDNLRFNLISRGSDDIIICGFMTYKELT